MNYTTILKEIDARESNYLLDDDVCCIRCGGLLDFDYQNDGFGQGMDEAETIRARCKRCGRLQ